MLKYIKKYWYFFIVFVIFFSILFFDNDEVIDNVVSLEKSEEVVDTFYVDIKGEVLNPGVYEVTSNTRVNDVIILAGGLTSDADISLINLSKKVSDEMLIRIYSTTDISDAKSRLSPTIVEVIKEVEKSCICPKNESCDSNNDAISDEEDINNTLININTASKEELMTIPKIGESKAISIIEYRNNTKFNSIEDIKNVSGIGDALYESIKSYITI